MAEVTRHGIYYSEKTNSVHAPLRIEDLVDLKCPECGHIFTVNRAYINESNRSIRAWCNECDCLFIPDESDIVKKG
jgi:uncharacterized OB-fold protein